MKTILRLAQKPPTKPTLTRCLQQQGFRDALQRLTMTLMLVMFSATAAWADTETVSYIDADGNQKTVEATILTGNEPVSSGDINFAPGWYVVKNIKIGVDVSYTSRICNNGLEGTIHIILCDGAEMNVTVSGSGSANDGISLNSLSPLAIYGQNKGTGRLTVSSNSVPIRAQGGITINGGIVSATGTSYGITSDMNDITINGGQVTATGANYGIRATHGTITLGWHKATDFIKVKSYGGTVNIADGQSFVNNAATPEKVSGTDIDKALVNNKTLTPYGITLTANANGSDYWTTYYNGALNFSTTATIYKAALNGTSSVTLTPVEGGVIPAGNAALLKAAATPIELTLTDATTGDYSGNQLQGVDVETANPGNAYVLSKVNDKFGFYKLSNTKTLAAHKAYLEVTTGAPEYLGFGENTTSLSEELRVKSEDRNATLSEREFATATEWYTLSGVRLNAKPTEKGLYIVNGKKRVINH